MVIFGHLTFTLEYLNKYTWLVVRVSCECLGFLCWDSSVTWDKGCHHTSSGLESLGKWGYIEKKEILNLARGLTTENGALNCGSVSNSFIGVDVATEFLSVEEFCN